MLSGSDSEDDIPVGRSARKRLLPKSPVSESEESDADETTPLKTSKPAVSTRVYAQLTHWHLGDLNDKLILVVDV